MSNSNAGKDDQGYTYYSENQINTDNSMAREEKDEQKETLIAEHRQMEAAAGAGEEPIASRYHVHQRHVVDNQCVQDVPLSTEPRQELSAVVEQHPQQQEDGLPPPPMFFQDQKDDVSSSLDFKSIESVGRAKQFGNSPALFILNRFSFLAMVCLFKEFQHGCLEGLCTPKVQFRQELRRSMMRHIYIKMTKWI